MSQTVEERRARDREYQRRSRERKRLAAAEAAEAARAAQAASPGRMTVAFESSVKAARWLTDSDESSVVQARIVAEMIDELELVGTADARRLQLRAQSVLLGILRDLAMTPAKRMSFELRSRRAEEAAAVAAAPNVTKLTSKSKRPAKRRREGV